jgi:hypothetical protein
MARLAALLAGGTEDDLVVDRLHELGPFEFAG